MRSASPPRAVCPTARSTCRPTHLVDPSEEGASNGHVQRGRLVSVFLTPDFEPPEIVGEVTDTDRGQRFDGVLRFDPDLVVLLESKVCRTLGAARRRARERAEPRRCAISRAAHVRAALARSARGLVAAGGNRGALPRRARARAGHARLRPPGLRASAPVRQSAPRRCRHHPAQVAAALAAARSDRHPARARWPRARAVGQGARRRLAAARGAGLRRGGPADAAHVAGRAQAPGRASVCGRPRRAPVRAGAERRAWRVEPQPLARLPQRATAHAACT